VNDIKAVIFDMDGLLLDSEKIAFVTFLEACREHGFEPDLKIYYQCIGTNDAKTEEILTNGLGRDFPYQAVSKLWVEKYHNRTLYRPVPVKEGALSLLHYLEGRGLKKVVVTSSHKKNAIIKLENTRMLHFFDFILGGDEISKGKPDPEMYLVACRKIKEAPASCLALEDSDNGVRSAFGAGLEVIQVPDLKEPSEEVKALGHTIVKSLVEVEDIFKRLDRA
jgi:HAD superfamily hydrolase (TIGR01509 family)